MTRLTKDAKARMIDRIMADIPKPELPNPEELLREACISHLPPEVRKLWDSDKLHDYVHIEYVWLYHVRAAVPLRRNATASEVLTAEQSAAVHEAHTAKVQLLNARESLRRELEANFESITTDKQVVERFPDLAKYLPTQPVAAKNLPATTELMDKLKAAGLPVATEDARENA